MDPAGDSPPLVLPYGWKADTPKFALSRDADRVAVASNVQVASWDLGRDDPAGTRFDLARHEGYIQSVAVSDDGTRLATGMIDGPVRLWEANAPANVVPLPQATRNVMLLAFIDHDRKLVTGDQDRTLAVWDLDPASMMDRARRVAGRELTAEERSRFLEL